MTEAFGEQQVVSHSHRKKGWSAGSLTRACEGDAGHP